MERESARKRQTGWTCRVATCVVWQTAANCSTQQRNFAAKSSAKWQACYTYSINQLPTGWRPLAPTHTHSLLLPLPLSLLISLSHSTICRLSIIEGHCRTSEISFWFLLASPFGIVFAFDADLLASLQHAACGMQRIYGMPQTFI